jgi:hypothetical protein
MNAWPSTDNASENMAGGFHDARFRHQLLESKQ